MLSSQRLCKEALMLQQIKYDIKINKNGSTLVIWHMTAIDSTVPVILKVIFIKEAIQ